MAMIQLFNGMQSSLSMVYDREMAYAHAAREPITTMVSAGLQAAGGNRGLAAAVYAFLMIAVLWDITPPPIGYLTCCRP